MSFILHVVFWCSASIVLYVYTIFPVLLYLLARCFPTKEIQGDSPLPFVSLIISAYNESAVIREKLTNAFSLDYPKEKWQVVVVSDSSSDGTDEIVREFGPRGALLVRQEQRLGKSSGLNLGVPKCTGSVIVFSDANALYAPNAIKELVKHFVDPAVGYVVGNARYIEHGQTAPSATSEGLYWKLETWLKRNESKFGSVVGGDGAIYAIRRSLYSPLLPTDINDLLNPLQIILQGYRGIYEPAAVCGEEAGESFDKEFRRKVRIVGRSLNAVLRAAGALLPWNNPRHWFALISHKLLRWFVPVFLILIFASSLALARAPFFLCITALQCLFYTLATIGWTAAGRQKCPKIFYISFYFCLVNLASLIGVVQLCFGSLSPTWTTIRDKRHPVASESAPLVRRES
jgi:cellulose synthase/poly-beta-1,6-N-acetylglucosamine synthase-like glycosyltransferase